MTFFSSILLFFFFVSQNIFAQTFFYWGEIYLTNFTSLSIFKCTFSGINSTVTQASPLPPEFFHHPVQNLLNNNSPSPPPPPTPRKHLFYVPFPSIWLSWVSRKCDVNNNPWIRAIPWSRKWQPIPAFLPDYTDNFDCVV